MTTALFAPRADHVDDTFWIETSQTSKVTEALLAPARAGAGGAAPLVPPRGALRRAGRR